MAPTKVTVRFTANFEANLAQIESFWVEHGAPQAWVALLDELETTVIVNRERHPRIGRKFFERSGQSIEVRARVALLLERFGAAEVREYLSGDYVLLYSLSTLAGVGKGGLVIHLLAIKHHRQLSFDFAGLWPSGGTGAGG